ncbi:winged helix-turn-helix domain-containing protein [Tropicimonas sp. IMCC6043]|uniref:winged helix-turn-helix domain-containing tetratricopeptide repeat protein n=1 Tax=Tropicimonas sp. IMCC6043 TaxID=2510645 RepID=UPI0013ECC783|nr:winged helix-turn-helix domain-containing protein [Tropicimonas sp. IMCC6043]
MDIQFGEYQLFKSERRLHGPQGSVQLGDRACEVLSVLLERASSVVGKNELLDAVWPNLAVEENTLQVHISALRKALGPNVIRTVHGRGYQYVGPPPTLSDHGIVERQVREGRTTDTSHNIVPAQGREASSTHVVILPFSSLLNDRFAEMVSDGLWEDVVIELGRYRHLAVTPYRSRLNGTVQNPSAVQVGRHLAADFVVEGRLRFVEQTIRMNVQLIDVETGMQVWGERFDFAATNVFSVQDSIVDALISHLSFNLDDAAQEKRTKDPTTSKTAYTYFLKARSTWRAGDEALAMQFAQKAVEADPRYGRAHAYVAFFYGYSLFSQQLGLGSDQTVELAEGALEQAMRCDRNDPFTLQKASMTLIMLGRPRDGLRLSEASLRIGARDGEIVMTHGHALIACGSYEKGRALMEQAMSPTKPFLVPPGFFCGLGEGRHICRDYAGSLAALEMMPDPPYYITLLKAANLARLGDREMARQIVDSAPVRFDTVRYARNMAKTCALAEDIEHYLASFRLAGIEV